MMKTKERKQGISLIVLIVTIIVVIILAAVVILTLSKNNPIESAKEARFKEDIRTFQDELSLTVSKEYANSGGHRDEKISTSDFKKMKQYIPSFSEKYKGKFKIDDDELKYTNVTDQEKDWCESLNVKTKKLYTELEYIESTGQQYIETGIKHTGNDIKQVMTVSFTKYVSSGEYGLISTWGGGYNYSNLYLSTGKKLLSYLNGNMGNSISVDLNTKYDIEHIYDLNGSYGQDHIRSLKVNDSIVSTNFSGVSTQNTHTFKIFCRWDLEHKSYMRLYALKLYVDGELILDYIPVLDINNRPCLFDKISNTFFYNQGTGEDFIPGPEV